MQSIFSVQMAQLTGQNITLTTIELSPNEFTDNNDAFGFMVEEKEPYSFLSIEKVQTDLLYHPVPQF